MLSDPSSARDVDLLVTFAPEANWGLFDHQHMEDELAALLGRRVVWLVGAPLSQVRTPYAGV